MKNEKTQVLGIDLTTEEARSRRHGGALALLAGLVAVGALRAVEPFSAGARLQEQRRCPKCGGRAIWHETTAYCTKSRCGWFEVVRPAPKLNWQGWFVDRFIQTCNECGRSIMPGERFVADMVSGHLVRHAECHEKAEAQT